MIQQHTLLSLFFLDWCTRLASRIYRRRRRLQCYQAEESEEIRRQRLLCDDDSIFFQAESFIRIYQRNEPTFFVNLSSPSQTLGLAATTVLTELHVDRWLCNFQFFVAMRVSEMSFRILLTGRHDINLIIRSHYVKQLRMHN